MYRELQPSLLWLGGERTPFRAGFPLSPLNPLSPSRTVNKQLPYRTLKRCRIESGRFLSFSHDNSSKLFVAEPRFSNPKKSNAAQTVYLVCFSSFYPFRHAMFSVRKTRVETCTLRTGFIRCREHCKSAICRLLTVVPQTAF